jgi:hypothetical protein
MLLPSDFHDIKTRYVRTRKMAFLSIARSATRLLKIQSERYHLNSSSFQWKTSSSKKQMAPPHNTKVPREFEFQIPQPIWNTTFSRINHIGSLSIFLSFEMSPEK